MFSNGICELRKPEGNTVSIAVAGDVCPGCGAEKMIADGRSSEILKDIQPVLDRADLRIVQWETVITDKPSPITKCGPCLAVPVGSEKFIEAGRFDIALLANNHIGDHSPTGVMETICHIRNTGAETVGAGENAASAARPLRLEKNGLKISVINACEMEFGTAQEECPGSNAMDELENMLQIAGERKHNHVVLVILHGGNEHNPLPSPRARQLYTAFARAGASAVINIHPHCPQGIDMVDGVPVIYSPGNFFFPYKTEFDLHNFWWSGYLPRLSFDCNGVFEIELTPYKFSPDPWRIELLHGAERQWFLDYVDKISNILQTECQHWFDIWCAMDYERPLIWLDESPAAALRKNLCDREALQKLPPIRHAFTCQAHCELSKRILLLIERRKMADLMGEIPQMVELQTARFCEKT